jgi:hypothetical protein
VAATVVTTAVAAVGMQVIEKKLTMDQMLQEKGKFFHRSPAIRPILEVRSALPENRNLS